MPTSQEIAHDIAHLTNAFATAGMLGVTFDARRLEFLPDNAGADSFMNMRGLMLMDDGPGLALTGHNALGSGGAFNRIEAAKGIATNQLYLVPSIDMTSERVGRLKLIFGEEAYAGKNFSPGFRISEHDDATHPMRFSYQEQAPRTPST